MMLNTIGAIAAGGALGAVMRHGVNILSLKLAGDNFPWGTLGVNVIGSFAIGLLVAIFANVWQPPQELKLFLITGVLGGFTTFSAFSLDTALLIERGELTTSLIYVLTSVVVSIAALFAAMALIRGVTA